MTMMTIWRMRNDRPGEKRVAKGMKKIVPTKKKKRKKKIRGKRFLSFPVESPYALLFEIDGIRGRRDGRWRKTSDELHEKKCLKWQQKKRYGSTCFPIFSNHYLLIDKFGWSMLRKRLQSRSYDQGSFFLFFFS